MYTCYIQSLKILACFCGCAGRFVSYLVANPEDRFSRDEARIILQKFKLYIDAGVYTSNKFLSSWQWRNNLYLLLDVLPS